MNNPKVSIIVPIYNVENYLDRCVQSLLNQTLMDVEIILVDDGSSDKCPKMCDEYAEQDERIKVIHKSNAGLGYARNSGIEIATSDYIAFIDSDDYVDVNMFNTMYDYAIEHSADGVFCGFRKELKPGVWADSHEVDNDIIMEHEEIYNFMLNMIASGRKIKKERLHQMSVWHAIYRREIIAHNNIRFQSEREVVSEDIPFQIDFLMKASKIAYLKNSFYYYCLNGGSLSMTFKPEKFSGYCKLRHCLLLKNTDSEYRNRVNRLFVGYTRSYCYKASQLNLPNIKKIYKQIFRHPAWVEVKKQFDASFLPMHSGIMYRLMSRQYIGLLYIFIKCTQRIKKQVIS